MGEGAGGVASRSDSSESEVDGLQFRCFLTGEGVRCGASRRRLCVGLLADVVVEIEDSGDGCGIAESSSPAGGSCVEEKVLGLAFGSARGDVGLLVVGVTDEASGEEPLGGDTELFTGLDFSGESMRGEWRGFLGCCGPSGDSTCSTGCFPGLVGSSRLLIGSLSPCPAVRLRLR